MSLLYTDLDELRRAIDERIFYQLEKLKIKLVDNCNLRCLKCAHWHSSRRHRPDQMTPLTTSEWLDVAEQAAREGVKKVVFSGGEPTLYPGLVDLVACFTLRGIHCQMTTNGTLLSGGLAERLAQAGMSQVTFSIDGGNSEVHDRSVGVPGAFRKVEEGIQSIRAARRPDGSKIAVTISTVVMRFNVDRLVEIVEWAAHREVQRIALLELHASHLSYEVREALELDDRAITHYRCHVVPQLMTVAQACGIEVVPEGYSVSLEGVLEALPREHLEAIPCIAAWTSATIFPGGDLYACCNSRHEMLHYGNIRKASLKEMLEGVRASQVLSTCDSASLPDCRACNLNLWERLELGRLLGFVPGLDPCDAQIVLPERLRQPGAEGIISD